MPKIMDMIMVKTKRIMRNKAIKIFFIVDLGVVIFCVLSGHMDWLINTQIAFFSSLIVTVGSFIGYQKNVQLRASEHINEDDTYDELDKMDDKYDLYSPQIEELKVNLEPTKEEIQEAMKPIKQNYFANFKSGFSGMASLYRLFGYVGLIVGFFYLNNNGILHVYSYVFGFIIVPISALALSLSLKKNN